MHNFKLIRAFVILKEITCFNKIVDKISITHPILKSDEKSTQRVFCRNIKNSGFPKNQLNCTLLYTKEPFPLNQFTLYQKPSPISQPLPWDPSIPFHVKLLIKTFAIFKAKKGKQQFTNISHCGFPPPLSHSKTKKEDKEKPDFFNLPAFPWVDSL